MNKQYYLRFLPCVLIFIILLIFLMGCQPIHLTSSEIQQTGQDDGSPLFMESEEGGGSVVIIIEIAIGLLFISSLVGIGTQRLRVPYTVGLVLIGLALSLLREIEFQISPNLFLAIFVPPLVFEAAFHLKLRELKHDIAVILALAIPGVLVTTFLVGSVLTFGAGFSLPLALVFGSLVAASDPIAVIALFRSLGTPRRLNLLLEGESLLNDGTAIVLFNLMVGIALTGEFDLLSSIYDFLLVSGGGIAVGLLLGFLISAVISSINDAMIETTLTSILAFGSYLIAEQFHLSGVLAVVAAGVISGNLGPTRMAPSTKIMVFNFWEYAAYLANSFVFLLIGLKIDLGMLLTNWQGALWGILAVLVARAVVVYGFSWVGKGIPSKYKHVLYWGGLRGAISLALSLSLPSALGDAQAEIQSLAFGVVLFTLLFQGMTMKPLIMKMNLIQRSEVKKEYENRQARTFMARASYEHLKGMYEDGLLSKHIWDVFSKPLEEHAEALAHSITKTMHDEPGMETEELNNALREILQTQRSALHALLREGRISEETYTKLINEVDTAITERQVDASDLLRHKISGDINSLMTLIVQEPDVENVTTLLAHMGLPVTQLSSTGGFLGQKNTTLIIGYPERQYPSILSKIQESSQERVQSIGREGEEVEISIKGATMFTFDIQRFEEL